MLQTYTRVPRFVFQVHLQFKSLPLCLRHSPTSSLRCPLGRADTTPSGFCTLLSFMRVSTTGTARWAGAASRHYSRCQRAAATRTDQIDAWQRQHAGLQSLQSKCRQQSGKSDNGSHRRHSACATAAAARSQDIRIATAPRIAAFQGLNGDDFR